jgi:hypothetical protein
VAAYRQANSCPRIAAAVEALEEPKDLFRVLKELLNSSSSDTVSDICRKRHRSG